MAGRTGTRHRRVAAGSAFASFATQVTAQTASQLRYAETLALRGEYDRALDVLRVAAAVAPTSAPDGDLAGDMDRVAIGELAVIACAWSGNRRESYAFLDELAESVTGPDARGALLFQRARLTIGDEATSYLTSALSEFAVAGNARGRAVVMADLSWPEDDSVPMDRRLALGRDAVELAAGLDDPWAMAYCAGRLAACESIYDLGDPLAVWARAAAAMPEAPDSLTSEVATLNKANWSMTALAHGRYAEAVDVTHDGRLLAHGTKWAGTFKVVSALVSWRTGDYDAAVAAARDCRHSSRRGVSRLASIPLTAIGLEREARPDPEMIDEALRELDDDQMVLLATAVQAEVRVARNEPAPLRDVPAALEHARRQGHRLGFEDLAVVLAEHDPSLARHHAAALADLWTAYPRGLAARCYVEGLLASSHTLLVEAAERFDALPEPLLAGRAWLAAARTAAHGREAGRLRRVALERFQSIGAERSLAGLVRERSLHRGEGYVEVPASMRRLTSAGLTGREREVATLIARGMTADEIAGELHITLGTARNYVLRVREKFGGVPKRKLAAMLAEA